MGGCHIGQIVEERPLSLVLTSFLGLLQLQQCFLKSLAFDGFIDGRNCESPQMPD